MFACVSRYLECMTDDQIFLAQEVLNGALAQLPDVQMVASNWLAWNLATLALKNANLHAQVNREGKIRIEASQPCSGDCFIAPRYEFQVLPFVPSHLTLTLEIDASGRAFHVARTFFSEIDKFMVDPIHALEKAAKSAWTYVATCQSFGEACGDGVSA